MDFHHYGFMKKIFLLGLSFIISGILSYYLLTHSHWTEWRRILFNLNPVYLAWYLSLCIVGLLLRTFRYHLLLKSR